MNRRVVMWGGGTTSWATTRPQPVHEQAQVDEDETRWAP